MMKKAKKYFCACGGDDDSNGNSNSSVGDDGVLDKDDGASNSQDKISLREKVVRLSPEKFKRRASHEKGTTLGLKSKKRKTKIANRICAGVAEEDALQLKLPDILCDKLLVLIVGINPGVWSSAKGRHYGGPGNHFWPCLNASGILPQGTQFSCENDISCVNHGIGFANMVARTTRGMADLSRTEIEGGTSNIKRIAAIYKPKIICFNGKGIYQIFSGNSKCNYGVQDMVVAGSKVFVMPSTSPRGAAFPRWQDKLPFFKHLAALVALERKKIKDINVRRSTTPKIEENETNISTSTTSSTTSSTAIPPRELVASMSTILSATLSQSSSSTSSHLKPDLERST
eukprot:m.90547 g.90547  ORF g.90547 m.90547 type:complete len:343 (-) comp8850_c1_seq31:2137-3165(-)